MTFYESVADLAQASAVDGQSIAIEGYNHLIPFAFAHELIKLRRTDLCLFRLSADLISDQLVGAGCVARLTTGWQGNPVGGTLPRLKDARENGWPRSVTFTDLSHPSMIAGYTAGASAAPFGFVTDLHLLGPSDQLRRIKDPFAGEEFAVIAAIRPEVAVFHAQRADTAGNVQFEGVIGATKEVAYASSKVFVTVEEIVEGFERRPDDLVLPSELVDGIAKAPRGAAPGYVEGMYARDEDFYLGWKRISGDRDEFRRWVEGLGRN